MSSTGKLGQKCPTPSASVKQSNSLITSLSRDRLKPTNNNYTPSLPLKTNRNSPSEGTTTNRIGNNASKIVMTPRSTVSTNLIRKTNPNSVQEVDHKLQSPHVRQITRRPVLRNNDISPTLSQQPLKKLANSPVVVPNISSSRVTPTNPSITRRNVLPAGGPLARREIFHAPVITRKATNTTVVHNNINKTSSLVRDELLDTKRLTNINSTRNKQSKKANTLGGGESAVTSPGNAVISSQRQEQKQQYELSSGSSSNGQVSSLEALKTTNKTIEGHHPVHKLSCESTRVVSDELRRKKNSFDDHLLLSDDVSHTTEIVKLKEDLRRTRSSFDDHLAAVSHNNNTEIVKLKEELGLRDEEVLRRNSELVKLKELLQSRDEHVRSQNLEIEKLKEALNVRSGVIQSRNSEINQSNEQLRRLDYDFQKRNSEFVKLQEELQLQVKNVESRDLEIIQLKNELHSQDENSESRNSEIVQLKKDLQVRDENIEIHKSEIIQLKEKVCHHESDITHLNTQLSQLNKNFENCNSDITTLTTELHHQELQLVNRDQRIIQLEDELQKEKTSRLTLVCDQNQKENVNQEQVSKLQGVIEDQKEEIDNLKQRTEHLHDKLARQTVSIQTERIHMKEMESDICTVVRCADERWIKAEMETKKIVELRNQAQQKVEDLEDKIDAYEEDIILFRALLAQKPEMFDVGVQVNSATIRYGTENNNIQSFVKDVGKSSSKSTAVSGISREGDKENHVDAFLLSSNDDFENYGGEVEKSVIKPLTHADSKRNTLFTELDPLSTLAQNYGGSRRKALLAWCQQCTSGYDINIDDFSTCWANGIGFCSLLHFFLPTQIPFDSLDPENAEKNLNIAFKVAKTIGVNMQLDISEMLTERPSWQRVMNYLAELYNCLAVL